MNFEKLEPSHVLRRPQQTCFARFLLLTLGILSFGSLMNKLPESFQEEQHLEKTFLNHRTNLEAREMLVMDNEEKVKHNEVLPLMKMKRQHQAILEVKETAFAESKKEDKVSLFQENTSSLFFQENTHKVKDEEVLPLLQMNRQHQTILKVEETPTFAENKLCDSENATFFQNVIETCEREKLEIQQAKNATVDMLMKEAEKLKHEKASLESSLLKIAQEKKLRMESMATVPPDCKISERSSRKHTHQELLIVGAFLIIHVSCALIGLFQLCQWTGCVESGLECKQHSIDSGWTVKRLKHKRKMRQCSDFRTFEEICASVPHNAKWVDSDRPPPHKKEIVYRDPDDADENRGVKCELFKRPLRTKSGADTIDFNDVKQGRLGDCWFLAAVSAVAAIDALDDRSQDKGHSVALTISLYISILIAT